MSGTHRLTVFAVKDGEQPITHSAITLVANGEIYNHEALKADPSVKDKAYTASDCSGIIAAYETYGKSSMCQVIQALDGFFVFVLHDGERTLSWRPETPLASIHVLAVVTDDSGLPPTIAFAEAKALLAINGAHIYNFLLVLSDIPIRAETDAALVRETLCTAVKKRLMVEAPFGVLLSGGLDSSLIASIAARLIETLMVRSRPTRLASRALPTISQRFKVAAHIKRPHTAFGFTVDRALDALPDVIRHLETFDITTIRASTPMYLLSNAPLTRSSTTNVLAVWSSCISLTACGPTRAPWPLALKPVPFLDAALVEAVSESPIASRRPPRSSGKPIESISSVMPLGDWLPDRDLWRAKEQFSDGVGFSWIDSLKQTADLKVTDVQLLIVPTLS
ncbi:hypothetical protein BSLG_001908 [Batrachochytrium salamandrivorans]|nr:hypothetical protein BSLG_001908 [Batrachochytrium salamandrivorans]